MKCLLLLPLLCTRLIAADCLPVSGDRILGSDLAIGDPRFAVMPATAPVGYAPMPGSPRVFRAVELQAIARSAGIKGSDFTEVCFEIPVHAPTERELLLAIIPSLPAEAAVRILDMDRAPIPAGRIEFPLSGLEPPRAGMDASQLWRGFVQYSDTRRVGIWLRVSIAITYRTVVARKDIVPDIAIDAGDLLLETRTGSIRREPAAAKSEDVAGHVVIRAVKAGSEVPLSYIAEAPAVRRGDLVRVEVQSGKAILHFDAVAETSARAGEFADFRNPLTGKTFRARAERGSKALIVVGKGPA